MTGQPGNIWQDQGSKIKSNQNQTKPSKQTKENPERIVVQTEREIKLMTISKKVRVVKNIEYPSCKATDGKQSSSKSDYLG